MRIAIPVLVLSLCLCACHNTVKRPHGLLTLDDLYGAADSANGGFLYLDDMYRKAGVTVGYAPGPTNFVLFACSGPEIMNLANAKLTIARIGKGSTPETTIPHLVPTPEARLVLARLIDFHSYMDRSACMFDPAIRLHAHTQQGTYIFDVCFACDDISITLPSGIVRTPHMSKELKRKLLVLTQQHYPNDITLGKLYKHEQPPIEQSDAAIHDPHRKRLTVR